MEYTIPKNEQNNVMETFWTMLRECESKADNEDDRLLKHWVGAWYRQWNRVTSDNKKPVWVIRKDLAATKG